MSYILCIICIISVVVLDQITKYIAVEYLQPIGSVPVIEDVFHFTYVKNSGAAFGMLKDHRWIFMIISAFIIVLVFYLIFKYKRQFHPLMLVGLSFTVGGGIGNMIDRVIKEYVVDFLDFTLIDFPVFNVADIFVCVGVGLIILDIILFNLP
jgi:signal peptidase II